MNESNVVDLASSSSTPVDLTVEQVLPKPKTQAFLEAFSFSKISNPSPVDILVKAKRDADDNTQIMARKLAAAQALEKKRSLKKVQLSKAALLLT